VGRPSEERALDRKQIFCLEAGRNLRYCGGANWYEAKIECMKQTQRDLAMYMRQLIRAVENDSGYEPSKSVYERARYEALEFLKEMEL
jgi:hypothetical protein